MEASPIGADDDRILQYARLVDPDAWSAHDDPGSRAIVRARIRFSLEAGYRISLHEGGVADPTDVVSRLSMALDLHDTVSGLQIPSGIDLSELAALAETLMTGGESVDAISAGTASVATLATSEDADVVDDGEPDRHDTATGGDGEKEEDEEDASIDPDHDPEDGISHVGDADAGQYYEEQP